MKKLLSLLLVMFLLFSGLNYVNASNQSKINDTLNEFYLQLDQSVSNIKIRISKLEMINSKIKYIKKNKWNNITDNSKELLILMETNINIKINFYKKELDNQKEEIDISDLLNDLLTNENNTPLVENNNITSLNLDSEDFKKTYYSSNLLFWTKIKLWSFKINSDNNYKVEIEFKDYDWYPAVDFKNLYLEDASLNKIFYDSNIASLWAAKQTFHNVVWWKNYILYWIVKEYYGWEENFWISVNKIDNNSIGRVLSHIKYKK